MEPIGAHHISQFILKVASRCNLNCPYCYVYNKGDSTWKIRPPLMSDGVFQKILTRIRNHCRNTCQNYANIIFHGGEPCLIGVEQFDAWCDRAAEFLKDTARADFSIQTNGTLIDDAWVEVFRKHRVKIGISMDGPAEIHDANRPDHAGRGSYAQVENGIRLLAAKRVPYGILCVIPFGVDPLLVHGHFMSLGCKQVTYVLPHYTYDNVEAIRNQYGPTPCADFLIPVFDEWWFNGTPDIHIGDLRNMARVVMGGESHIETIGNVAPRYVFIESDGEVEGLDNLRSCSNGITQIGVNVRNNEFLDILAAKGIHGRAIFQGMPLCKTCQACPEVETCGGGYLPHRYSRLNGFDNPSVWCADLLKIFTHIRMRMEVSVEETRERRLSLRAKDAEAELLQPAGAVS